MDRLGMRPDLALREVPAGRPQQPVLLRGAEVLDRPVRLRDGSEPLLRVDPVYCGSAADGLVGLVDRGVSDHRGEPVAGCLAPFEAGDRGLLAGRGPRQLARAGLILRILAGTVAHRAAQLLEGVLEVGQSRSLIGQRQHHALMIPS